jgi:predicted RNA-binding Zn-ribbon protein involved in translation (DUF1610 family)
MGILKLACPNCGFVIEEFTDEELSSNPRKAKRLKYLKGKQSWPCANCGRVLMGYKEIREGGME